MNAVRAWVRTLQPADIFAPPVMLGAAAEYAVVLFASPYNTRQNYVHAALVQLLPVAAVFALAVATHLGLRRRLDTSALRSILLACVPTGALIGGLVVAWARFRLDMDPVPMWGLRSSNAVIHVTAVTFLLWIAVSRVRALYGRINSLQQERYRLEQLEQQATQMLASLNQEATETVRSGILVALQRADAEDAGKAVAALSSILEDTVRPLSRQLEARTEDWSPPMAEPRSDQRIDWMAAAADGMSPELPSPLGVLVILNLVGASMNVFRSGLLFELQFVLISTFVVWPAFRLIHRGFSSLVRDAHRRWHIPAFVAMCVSWGLALGAAMLPITLGAPHPWRFLYLAPIFSLILAFIWGLTVAAQQQARSVEAQLQEITVDLTWRIARSRELHRQRRRALAHALHGRVQAALAAGILELERDLQAGVVGDVQIRTVRDRIAECVQELDLREMAPLDVGRIAEKVRATWAGVLTVCVDIDPSLQARLECDRQTLTTLNDVIPELAFNSIKHGKASGLTITLEAPDRRTVRLTAEDDGATVPTVSEAGMGSRLLNTCAIEWSRERRDGHTVTTMVLPLASSADTVTEGFPLESKGFADISA